MGSSLDVTPARTPAFSFVETHGDNNGSSPSIGLNDSAMRERKSISQMAHEEEARRVQETIRQSVQRIAERVERRR